ncbi:lysophospholipid acyltransferase family protein [Yoonia sp. 2307UL14-13]|uniref:lysophospholipid acyltransferase family protein n=1 Tax=Yoonia sp. 2307UL14-13 TaxID=3126506 RepID=UPI0030B1F2B7
MSFRKRLENSKALAWVLGFVARLYFGFCFRTTRWKIEGLEDLKAALADGPVILVVWHSRLLLGPYHWPLRHGQLSTIHTRSPIGRVVGALQRQLGLEPFEMSEKLSNVATSRQIMKRVKDGISIGITADGPEGPALVLKDPPLDWARATGRPVFSYAFATRRARRVSSWDRMLVPCPFTVGSCVFARFPQDIPRKMTPEDGAELRDDLQQFLKNTKDRADELSGVAAGP